MKDVKPEQTPKNAKVERYTNEIDIQNEIEEESKFHAWFIRQNAYLWGALIGGTITIYRNLDRIMSWF